MRERERERLADDSTSWNRDTEEQFIGDQDSRSLVWSLESRVGVIRRRPESPREMYNTRRHLDPILQPEFLVVDLRDETNVHPESSLSGVCPFSRVMNLQYPMMDESAETGRAFFPLSNCLPRVKAVAARRFLCDDRE